MCTNQRKIIKNGEEITVKCGKCFTCLKQRASDWTIKLINESKYYNECSFITLTFDNEKLYDRNGRAVKFGANPNFIYNIRNSNEYFTKFMKRLRKKLEPKKIKYYKIGEYGDLGKRPHYHVIIFGENFSFDRKECEVSKTGKTQYFSQTLEDIWACGRTRIQDCNAKNIAYICQYTQKKIKKYEKIEQGNGTLKEIDRYKPIQSFSNRSKMGVRWVRRNPQSITKGYLTDTDNHKYRVPNSYKENLKKDEKEYFKQFYRQYEQKMLENIKLNNLEQIEKEKIKEKIFILQNKEKMRDF